MKVFKWIFGKSKWLHKYIGLFIILFLVWSAFSGIILNHPGLFSGVSVPGWMVPDQYRTENWNRSSLIELLFMKDKKETGFAGGKKGIWKTTNGGRTFTRMSDGYTDSIYYGKVNDILLIEKDGEEPELFAASFGGLWVCDPGIGRWKKIFPQKGDADIKKVLKIREKIVLFTQSDAWESPSGKSGYDFKRIGLLRQGDDKVEKISLVRLFFDLHGGHAWGVIGRILFDIIGLIIIFLSVSSFYIWYFPKKWKKKKEIRKNKKSYGFFYKYHLKFGIWVAIILLLIGGTAFFMRPPFLALIARGDIDVAFYPGSFPDNPWDKKIHSALHLKDEGKVIIEATDGVWIGDESMKGKFVKTRIPILVFVMGATVFEEYPEGGYIIGSFNGLYHIPGNRTAIDMVSGKTVRFVSPVKPADKMISGYFRTPDGEEFITAFDQGVIPLKGADLKGRFAQPEELTEDNRLPLWNYMFELHNGRIFKDMIGKWYIVIIPLGSFFFVLISLTGIYDWFYTRFRK